MIQPVESLEITVLVDNSTDSLSTNPGFVETDMAGAWREGEVAPPHHGAT
jgi:7,8-dihydropterin-6-yl-methyl-4-(beta-D-ribofuranosyl)aminobenzene 5'-phosphate synthase